MKTTTYATRKKTSGCPSAAGGFTSSCVFALATTASAGVMIAAIAGEAIPQQEHRPSPYRVPVSSSFFGFPPYATLSIGTPAQHAKVLFDSGSPLLWTRGEGNNDTALSQADRQCPPPEYVPSDSSTSASVADKTSFAYGEGFMSGPTYADVVGFADESSPMKVLPRTDGVNVTVASATDNLPIECFAGLLGMDYGSEFMSRYQHQQQQNNSSHYFATNFSMDPSVVDSWFEIGLSGGGGGGDDENGIFWDPSLCVNVLPATDDPAVRMRPKGPTFTLWWQFDVPSFRIGTKTSDVAGSNATIQQQQALVDDGTSAVMGNFASIFHPVRAL